MRQQENALKELVWGSDLTTQLNVGKFSFFPFFRKDDALNIQIAVINLHLRQHKWPLLENCIMPPFPKSFLLEDIKRICSLPSSSSLPSPLPVVSDKRQAMRVYLMTAETSKGGTCNLYLLCCIPSS
jgi:hypothetical protein